MSGTYAPETLPDSRPNDCLSHSRTIKLVIQSSTSNFAGGQTWSSSPRVPPIRFQKLRMAPVITLLCDPLLPLRVPRAQTIEYPDIALTCPCTNDANICIPCDEHIDVQPPSYERTSACCEGCHWLSGRWAHGQSFGLWRCW